MHTAKDEFAKRHKIRIIVVERPGYGGTDEVELQDRLQVWQGTRPFIYTTIQERGWRRIANVYQLTFTIYLVDAIPMLLAHLNIKRVSVGCHSAGTVYALDFILHHPEYLHPTQPYLAIAGPWIPPSKSGVIGMRIVQSLPSAVIGKTDGFLGFMHSTVNPAIGTATSAVSSLVSLFATRKSPLASDAAETEGEKEMRMRPDLLKKAYSGKLNGMGADAVLMMSKVPAAATASDDDQTGSGGFVAGWSDWGNYEAYVPRLVEAMRVAKRKLTVHAFHAETDSMVGDYGDLGSTWFDGCWAKERCGDGVITYESSCVDDSDHDLVWSIKFGVAGKVFGHIVHIGQKGEDEAVTVAEAQNIEDKEGKLPVAEPPRMGDKDEELSVVEPPKTEDKDEVSVRDTAKTEEEKPATELPN